VSKLAPLFLSILSVYILGGCAASQSDSDRITMSESERKLQADRAELFERCMTANTFFSIRNWCGKSVDYFSKISDSRADEAERKLELGYTLAFKKCMAGETFGDIRVGCGRVANYLSDDRADKAEQRWADYLARKGPDYQLLDAVIDRDAKKVKKALAAGANINREFDLHYIKSSRASNMDKRSSVLELAIDTPDLELKVLTLLLDNGASFDSLPSDTLRQMIGRSKGYGIGDSRTEVMPLSKVGILLVDYGYRLTSEELLETVEHFARLQGPSDADQELVGLLLAVSAPDKAQLARERLAERENRKAELERLAQERSEAMAWQMLYEATEKGQREKKSTIGARLCRQPRVNSPTFVGYVEAVSGPKIKVRVEHAFIRGISLDPDKFNRTTIWDVPDNWDFCDSL